MAKNIIGGALPGLVFLDSEIYPVMKKFLHQLLPTGSYNVFVLY